MIAQKAFILAVPARPLVVDVDGTLIRTDLLHETALQFVARSPLEAWRMPLWLAAGRSRLKQELASRTPFDVASLPYRDETLAAIRAARADGRPIFLASASDRSLVERIAAHVGGIDGVFASDGDTNLAGCAKADALTDAFGEGGFDYIGDSGVDFDVWAKADQVVAVSHSGAFERRLRRRHAEATVLASPRMEARNLLKAMRPYQWSKNLLIGLPLIAGHHLAVASVVQTLLAFVCFCLAASSAYLLNDLLDLPGDRAHPRKRNRPLASGALPIAHGVVASGLLMALALGLGSFLPTQFLLVLCAYVGLTLAYSLVLKRKLLVDVIVLGGLYAIRVVAGLAAAGLAQSQWLLLFSLFIFLSLATVKRCAELIARRESGCVDAIGRGYRVQDLAVLFPMAAAAAYGAVLIFALYLYSPEVAQLYTHPTRMWLICPVFLYWISRVLVLTARNEMCDDPILFAIRDRVSWWTAGSAAGIIAISM